MGRVAYVGSIPRDLEPALIERVESIRRSDRHAPITILVGSNLLAAHLGRVLARRLDGVFNARFMTFIDVARSLAASAPGTPHSRIPPLADRVILEELLSGADLPPVFEDAASMKGFGEALRATFADLSEGGCTAETADVILAERARDVRLGEKTRATLELFGRYRRLVEEAGGDLHSIFDDALRGRPDDSFGSAIYVYGFYDLNEMQRRLLDLCAARADLEFFVPWIDGNEAYRFARPLRRRIERDGGAIRDATATTRVGCSEPALLRCVDEEEEVREIGRRILTLARGDAVRFEEMAVLLAAPGEYENLIRETFDEAGIPYVADERSLEAANPAARAARALLSILEHGIERRELVEFLVSAPLAAPERDEGRIDHAGLWIRRSAETGMMGERGWIEENDALIESIASAVEKGRMEPRSLDAAREAGRILRALCAARESIRTAAAWKDLSERFVAIVRSLCVPSAGVDDVCAVVESLAPLDKIGCAATLARFFRVAGEALESARAPRRRPDGVGGVSVMSLKEARGLSFRAAYLPGLAEGFFPAPARQDPFLPDNERAVLERASNGAVSLARKGERMAEDALLFAMALESGIDERTVSVPRFEQGTGKERIPSFFLRYAGFDAVEEAVSRPETVIRGRGGATRRGVEILSVEEYDFESARAALAGEGVPPANRFFLRGAALVRARSDISEFTAYDGVISAARARAELARFLEERGYGFSPSALERWAECPFAYFMKDVLKIETVEEPERVVSVTPPQRGTLIHWILARVFEAFASRGLLPLSGERPERLLGVAEEIASKALDEFPLAESVGLPVFWRNERRLVMESIRLLLEEERLDTEPFVPTAFERSFGWGKGLEEVAHDRGDRRVYFHGRIDRIDVAPDGRFRVVDYKTGKLDRKNQDLHGGTAIQLPVYLLAAAGILGRSVEEGEAFYRRVGAGKPRRVFFSGNRWGECSGEFSRIIETVTRGIEEGLFFATGDAACEYCSMKPACAPGAENLFERKARRDPRARGYLAMRGRDEEER